MVSSQHLMALPSTKVTKNKYFEVHYNYSEAYSVQFSSAQSLSRVRLLASPWTAARQASLSITNSRSSLKLTSIKSVMPSSHLILCHPLLLLPKSLSASGVQWVNQSILKEISPGCSLEGMMLKLKLQYFGHLMQRVDSLEKLWCWEGLGAGGEGDNRGWDGWMASLTRWTLSLSELRELVIRQGGLACCNSWGRKEVDTTERLIWSDLIQKRIQFTTLLYLTIPSSQYR